MAMCEFCGKKPSSGHNVSHSKRRTGRWWKPNVVRKRLTINGQVRRVYICTRCLRTLSKT